MPGKKIYARYNAITIMETITPGLVLVKLGAQVAQQNIIWSGASVVAHPLRLDSEEDPHPSSEDLQQFHEEDASFQVVEVIKMRRQLEAPRTAQQQVHRNNGVVDLVDVEIAVSPESVRMFGVSSVSGAGEEGEVPILGDVPVE